MKKILFLLAIVSFMACQRTKAQNSTVEGAFTAYGSGTANVTLGGIDTVYFKATIPATGSLTIQLTALCNVACDSIIGSDTLYVSLDGVYYFLPSQYAIPATTLSYSGPRDSLTYDYSVVATKKASIPVPPSTLTFTSGSTPAYNNVFVRTFYLSNNYYKFYMIKHTQAALNDQGSASGVPTKTWSARYVCRRTSPY